MGMDPRNAGSFDEGVQKATEQSDATQQGETE